MVKKAVNKNKNKKQTQAAAAPPLDPEIIDTVDYG